MKLLVSDFDKTLFTEDYLRNIEAINKFVDEGNMFIIATGRNIEQLKRDIVGYGIKYSYLVCNDGAIIIDNKDELIFRLDIAQNEVDDIINELKNDSNIESTLIDDGFIFNENHKSVKNAILGRFHERDKAIELSNKINAKYSSISSYISLVWVNIVNKDASKGNAIKFLQDKFKISTDDIYTVGDGTNDISMNSMFNGYYMRDDSILELMEVSKGSVGSVKELIEKIKEKND